MSDERQSSATHLHWVCPVCMAINKPERRQCRMVLCDGVRGGSATALAQPSRQPGAGAVRDEIEAAVAAERDRLLNTPELRDFSAAVILEALHQRERWGSEQDAGKAPADWFWLVGYLAGKALNAAIAGNNDKALHHTISTAAALSNWHAALLGTDNNMRPGIEPPAALEADHGA